MRKIFKLAIMQAVLSAAMISAASASAVLDANLIVYPDTIAIGQQVTVLMYVSNNGDTQANNVIPLPSVASALNGAVVSNLSGPSPSSITNLTPTAMGYFTWTYQVFTMGTVNFSGTAQGTEQGTGFTVNSSAATSNPLTVLTVIPSATSTLTPAATFTPVPTAPGGIVWLTVTAQPATIDWGTNITYTINYECISGSLSNYFIYDTIPSAVTFNSCSGCSQTAGSLYWYFGTLPANATGSVSWVGTFNNTVPRGSCFSNTAYDNVIGISTIDVCVRTMTPTLTTSVIVTPASPTATFTPTQGLQPDLVITGLSHTMDAPVPGCVPTSGPYPPLGIRVDFKNQGTGDAGPFTIAVLTNGTSAAIGGLSAGQSSSTWIQGSFAGTSLTARIDFYDTVAESDEVNNYFTQTAYVATPPPYCTAGTTPVITPTPTCACMITSTPTVWQTPTATKTAGTPVISPTFTPTPRAASASVSSGSVISALGGKASIRYELNQSKNVKILVYNRIGRLIKTLVSTQKNSGIYNADWDGVFEDGSKVPSGIYIIHVQIGDYTKKLKVAVKK